MKTKLWELSTKSCDPVIHEKCKTVSNNKSFENTLSNYRGEISNSLQ